MKYFISMLVLFFIFCIPAVACEKCDGSQYMSLFKCDKQEIPVNQDVVDPMSVLEDDECIFLIQISCIPFMPKPGQSFTMAVSCLSLQNCWHPALTIMFWFYMEDKEHSDESYTDLTGHCTETRNPAGTDIFIDGTFILPDHTHMWRMYAGATVDCQYCNASGVEEVEFFRWIMN